MRFDKAFKTMKQGSKVKLPSWGGYWFWSKEKQTIIMHTKDGGELDIRETQIQDYTFGNICYDEWVHNAWWEEKKKQGVTDHPDMIPYSELSEEVKEYDRVTARTTIEAFNYMTHSFIYINTTGLQTENPYAPKNKVPWTPSQADMQIMLFPDQISCAPV